MADNSGRILCILIPGDYKRGDPVPEGYLEKQEWAQVQHQAGLRQRRCPECKRWRFPQELPCNHQMRLLARGHSDG